MSSSRLIAVVILLNSTMLPENYIILLYYEYLMFKEGHKNNYSFINYEFNKIQNKYF